MSYQRGSSEPLVDEAINSGKRKHKSTTKTVTTMLICVAVVVVVVVVVTGGVGFAVSNAVLKDEIQAIDVPTVLPTTFSVPFYAITPVKDQAQRGTCWAFATIGLLEAQYRQNGYLKGFLAEDKYTSFSEQAYALGVTDYCTSHKEDPYCFGGPPTNQTADGEIEWLYYMRDDPNVATVIPYTVCPYYPTDEDQYICPDRADALKETPISFTVDEIESVYTISAMKSLLYKHKVPLGWSHAVFQRTYTVPCDDPNTNVYATSQCTAPVCAHPCTISSDGCCAELIIPGYTNEGIFQLENQAYQSGGHAMLLVGWNDEYRVDRGVFGQLNHYTTGGFILKNSWSYNYGHTIEYWMQGHSLLEEDLICPCVKSSLKWLPADSTCMLNDPDPVVCGDSERHIRNLTVVGATVLKCSDASLTYLGRQYGFSNCDSTKRYVLAKTPSIPDLKYQPSGVWTEVPANSDGTLHFYLVEYDPDIKTASIVKTNATTWWGLEKLFVPELYVENDKRCGYFLWPYETLTEGNIRYAVGGHDTPSVTYIGVTFADSSYSAASKAQGKDYSSLDDSTYTSKKLTFNGPFDFDWDKH